MEMGKRRLSLRGALALKVNCGHRLAAPLLHLQRTLEPPLPPLYLCSECRLPLGQFITAKTGRGGALCSEEDLMMSE